MLYGELKTNDIFYFVSDGKFYLKKLNKGYRDLRSGLVVGNYANIDKNNKNIEVKLK